MIKIEALLSLVPKAKFTWRGEEYSGLEWEDERPCPTEEEINLEANRLINTDFINKRRRIFELKKLLSDSDWTQVSDVAERKGQSFVDEWKAKRNVWWNEMRMLESE